MAGEAGNSNTYSCVHIPLVQSSANSMQDGNAQEVVDATGQGLEEIWMARPQGSDIGE